MLLSSILASMVQLRGPAHGWYLDPSPAAQRPLLLEKGPALPAALETLQALVHHSPGGLACRQAAELFAAGQCLMTISWGAPFKVRTGPGCWLAGWLAGRGPHSSLLITHYRCHGRLAAPILTDMSLW